MTLSGIYGYLVRARRDLWATLEAVPDEVLSSPLIGGARFQCIKDLVFHIASVEDFWIHKDILRNEPVLRSNPCLRETKWGPEFAAADLSVLIGYWKEVEQSTLTYLPTLTREESARVVEAENEPAERYTVDGLLWHVIIHEMRHTAQIAVLLRTQGIQPPALDLLYYLPSA